MISGTIVRRRVALGGYLWERRGDLEHWYCKAIDGHVQASFPSVKFTCSLDGVRVGTNYRTRTLAMWTVINAHRDRQAAA